MENRGNNESRRKKVLARRKKQRKIVFFCSIGIILVMLLVIGIVHNNTRKITNSTEQQINNNENNIVIEKQVEANDDEVKKDEAKKEIVKKEIVISAAGDCTLGTDTNFGYQGSFQAQIDNNSKDYSSIMKNVAPIFNQDDYTIVNLETTFTNATTKRDKGSGTQYHFKGPKAYASILTSSSIEGVTISNNHIYDYEAQGFKDTISVLDENKIDYCGEGYKIIKEIKNIKVGFIGYSAWSASEETKNKIKNDIKDLKDKGAKIVIPYFHWGIENSYTPNEDQIEIARFSIDNGADLVLGSHPHVIETLENYKGKLIAYSLGNFSFGGNTNPSDRRSFILQTKFKLENDEVKGAEFKVIPVKISSLNDRNNYSPIPALGEEKEDILRKLTEISPSVNKINSDGDFLIENMN